MAISVTTLEAFDKDENNLIFIMGLKQHILQILVQWQYGAGAGHQGDNSDQDQVPVDDEQVRKQRSKGSLNNSKN